SVRSVRFASIRQTRRPFRLRARRSAWSERHTAGKRPGGAAREPARQVIRQLASIVLGAVDEARFAAAQERKSHDVKTRYGADTAFMANKSPAIQQGFIEPGIVGAVAGCPQHGADGAAGKIQAQAGLFGNLRGFEAFGGFAEVRASLLFQPI